MVISYERRLNKPMIYKLIAPRDKHKSSIEQVLTNRGITDIEHYLNTTDADILEPTLLDNMTKGAKLLVSHIAKNSKVLVQIDSDVDGMTSAALLLNYLNKVFPAFTQNQISYRPHTGKQHGIILESIPDDVSLVIAPDGSSDDYDIHEELSKRGVDVLVLDHHEADHVSEYACVINNQLCDYPTKSLSGVGIVYKFCCFLDSLLDVDYANDLIDLVALGCVADMVDLRDYETKHLVSLGMKQITNPYFKGMTIKNEYSLGGEITPFGIAFYIAPYINAVMRSGTTDEKLILFEAMLDYKAYDAVPSTKRGCKGQFETRVEQACRNCANIKNRQTKTRDASLEIIEEIIERQNLLEDKILLITLNAAQKTNLSGLMANQLMSQFQRPVLILSNTIHEILDDEGRLVKVEMWWEGSFRGPNVPGLESVKDFFEESGFAQYTAGHANAGGIGIRDEDLSDFRIYCNSQLKDFDFTPTHKVDFIYDAKELDKYETDFYTLMEYKCLWGQEIEQPKIVIENIKLTSDKVQLMKGTTLKIIPSATSDLSAIKFKVSEQEYENLYSEAGCVTINVLGVCEKNTWNNKPQLIIQDYEIIDRQDYYF